MKIKVLGTGLAVTLKENEEHGRIMGWIVDANGHIQYVIVTFKWNNERMDNDAKTYLMTQDEFEIDPGSGSAMENWEIPSSVFGSIVFDLDDAVASGVATYISHYLDGLSFVIISRGNNKYRKIPMEKCRGERVTELSPEEFMVKFLSSSTEQSDSLS